MMKRAIILLLLMILLGLFINVTFFELPIYSSNTSILLTKTDSVDLNEGRKLALTICFSCHYNPQTETLSGRIHGNPEKLGSFYSGNITQHEKFGIGSWTDEDIYYFLVTGIKPNGEFVFDMPKYPNLSEEDLLSLIGFLRSDHKLVASTDFENPKPAYSFLMKAALHYWLRPIDINEINRSKTAVNKENQIEFGKYLSTAKYSCSDCHSRNAITNNYLYPEKSLGFFEGKNPHVNEKGEVIYSPSLIGISEKYSSAEFIAAVKYGITPFSSTLKDPMLPFVLLTDYEIESIYIYLSFIDK